MKKVLAVLLVCFVAFAMTANSFAEEQNAYTKGKRGLLNLATGWMEIPVGVSDQTKADNWLGGVTLGLCKGTVNAVGRTFAGAIELITFPFPTVMGNPTDYQPIVEPEFVWEKFESSSTTAAPTAAPAAAAATTK